MSGYKRNHSAEGSTSMKIEARTPNLDKPERLLRGDELDAVTGGFFASATAAAIDAVGKALATMAQKQ
jgi:hypothetical protein